MVIDSIDLAWLAAIVEGEGSVRWKRDRHIDKRVDPPRVYMKYRASVRISNTDELIIEAISDILRRAEVFHQVRKTRRLTRTHKQVWQVEVARFREVLAFICLIEPFMRGDKALLARTMIREMERYNLGENAKRREWVGQ